MYLKNKTVSETGHATFCTSQNPCGLNEGDCDSKDDCQTGLVCGDDNCPSHLGFESWVDCCYKGTTTQNHI